jgi:hypothetical protein
MSGSAKIFGEEIMVRRLNVRALLLVVVACSLSGCNTTPVNISTPHGAIPSGDLFAPLQVLGVSRRFTQSLNRSDGRSAFAERVTINVPVGTETIIPSVQGLTLMYGETDPNNLTDNNWQWHHEDHHLGSEFVDIAVLDINSPNNSVNPPQQSADIEIRLLLRDDNGDDKWFGSVTYTLLFLGRK